VGRGELVRLLGVSPGRESTAILIPVQIGVVLLIAAYLAGWYFQMYRRNRRLWDELLARMSPECRQGWTLPSPARAQALSAVWVSNPRAAFRDAGVLMEMADYAERNSLVDDPARMQAVRTAALRLRLSAASAMIRRDSLR